MKNDSKRGAHVNGDAPPPLQQSLGMGDELDRIRQKRSRDTVRRTVRGAINVELSSAQEELLATLLIAADFPMGKKAIGVRLDNALLMRLDRFVGTFKGLEKTRCIEVALERLLTDLGF